MTPRLKFLLKKLIIFRTSLHQMIEECPNSLPDGLHFKTEVLDVATNVRKKEDHIWSFTISACYF